MTMLETATYIVGIILMVSLIVSSLECFVTEAWQKYINEYEGRIYYPRLLFWSAKFCNSVMSFHKHGFTSKTIFASSIAFCVFAAVLFFTQE